MEVLATVVSVLIGWVIGQLIATFILIPWLERRSK